MAPVEHFAERCHLQRPADLPSAVAFAAVEIEAAAVETGVVAAEFEADVGAQWPEIVKKMFRTNE